MIAPKVTVVTPTYNHEKYIGACIESLLGQTYENWEQVIVDDGSTDRTAEVAAAYADPRIRLVRQENRGLLRLAETYNDVLRETDGPLVAILEGDDFWPANRLASLVPLLRDPLVGLAFGRAQLTTASGVPVGRYIPGPEIEEHRGSLQNGPIGAAAVAMADPRVRTFTFPCAVLLRRAALEDIGGFRCEVGLPFTDYPTFLELALRWRFAYVDEVTGYWRQLRSSGTRVRDEVDTMRRLDALVDRAFADPDVRAEVSLPSPNSLLALRREYRVKAHFDMGRRQLLHRQWRDARRHFIDALTTRHGHSIRYRGGAALGVAASLLHRDLEPVSRLFSGPAYDLQRLHA